MMDVERIQKINNLAMDLEKQGLAANREEAIAQAEKIFTGTAESEGYTSIKEGTEQPVQQQQAEVQSELSENSIKQILEQNTKFLVKTIKEFNEKIELLEKQVTGLKENINAHRIPTVKDLIAEEVQARKEPQTETNQEVEEPVQATPEPAPKPAQEEKKEAHPRVGNFSDTDVSIEKFFYMGSK